MHVTNGRVRHKRCEYWFLQDLLRCQIVTYVGSFSSSLSKAFLVGNNKPMRPPPPLFKTPPYVTARPVVTHRKLSFPPLDDSSENSLRFLVLATDGLWDQLRFVFVNVNSEIYIDLLQSSEEVVSLVGGHISGLKGTIPKTALPSLVPITSGSPTVEGKNKSRKNVEGSWAFVDDNISAHLIRNAFGGGDEMALRRLLSIPAPYSRRYRDDVTVTVVWWEVGREDAAKITSFSREKLKSKL
jgi:pyruvate dehydrogenase phosphatase